MLTALVVTVHIIVAFTLVLVVLLQVGKGGSIGAAFGGGGSSQTMFGSRGPATFLSYLTTGSATLFMITSLTLAFLSSNARNESSITDQVPAIESTPSPQTPTTSTSPDGTATPLATDGNSSTSGPNAPAVQAPASDQPVTPAHPGNTQQ